MDTCTKRKLNLLIHLAKVDGKFHDAEQALIKEFVQEKGFDVTDFDLLQVSEKPLKNLNQINNKKEILFLAIKLMQADDVIHNSEMAFCRKLAQKLGYKPAIIDAYANMAMDRVYFESVIQQWSI